MADTVTTQILFDGSRHAVLKFTNVSDGTGESSVLKADVSALTGSPTDLKIERIWFMTAGMAVNVFFDATTDVLAAVLPSDVSDTLLFDEFGGIQNNAGAGKTGNILFSTVGASAGDSYSIILQVAKS
jgi:hypothetical protein